MPIEWMLSVIRIAVLGILLILFSWRLYHARPNRRIFVSLILALAAGQGLVFVGSGFIFACIAQAAQ